MINLLRKYYKDAAVIILVGLFTYGLIDYVRSWHDWKTAQETNIRTIAVYMRNDNPQLFGQLTQPKPAGGNNAIEKRRKIDPGKQTRSGSGTTETSEVEEIKKD